jgi:hypothetical protein
VDVELLKRALRELAEREPAFLRDLLLEALRSDGRIADALLDLLTKRPEAVLRLAQAVAGAVAIPLNVATKDDIKAAVEELKRWAEERFATKDDIKRLESVMATKEDLKQYATKQDLEQLKKWAEERFVTREHFDAVIKRLEGQMATKEDLKQYATKQDLETAVEQLRAEIRRIEGIMATKEDLKRMATKEDLKHIENKMATKEQIEAIAISVEESGRDTVQYLLEQRGYRCAAERLRVDEEYEFDIYCNAGVLTAVGEAKVRAGRRDVERALERVRELESRRPEKISGRLVPVLYALVAELPAVQRARELKVWLIESRKEAVALEEALGTINRQ